MQVVEFLTTVSCEGWFSYKAGERWALPAVLDSLPPGRIDLFEEWIGTGVIRIHGDPEPAHKAKVVRMKRRGKR